MFGRFLLLSVFCPCLLKDYAVLDVLQRGILASGGQMITIGRNMRGAATLDVSCPFTPRCVLHITQNISRMN